MSNTKVLTFEHSFDFWDQLEAKLYSTLPALLLATWTGVSFASSPDFWPCQIRLTCQGQGQGQSQGQSQGQGQAPGSGSGPGPGSGSVDKDRNDQGTTAKLVDAGFLVSDKFHGKNMFDFLF